MLPGRSSVAKRWPSSWNGFTSLVDLDVTPVAAADRRQRVRVGDGLRRVALGVRSRRRREIVPSTPVKTCVFGMSSPRSGYWRFMVTRMKSIENVGCSVIVTIARCPRSPAPASRSRRAGSRSSISSSTICDRKPSSVALSAARTRALLSRPMYGFEPDAHAGLGVVDDAPHADLAERAGVGRDALQTWKPSFLRTSSTRFCSSVLVRVA